MIQIYKPGGAWKIGGTNYTVKCINQKELAAHIKDGWQLQTKTSKTSKTEKPKNKKK